MTPDDLAALGITGQSIADAIMLGAGTVGFFWLFGFIGASAKRVVEML